MKKAFIILAISVALIAQNVFAQGGTPTPNHGLVKPTIVRPDKDIWGQYYHNALDVIDDALPRNNVIQMTGETPSVVSGTNHFFKLSQPAPTTVMNFLSGVANQPITILAGDDNSTIDFTSSNLVRADGGGDVTLKTNNLLFCIHSEDASVWICNAIFAIEAIEIGAVNCVDCINEEQIEDVYHKKGTNSHAGITRPSDGTDDALNSGDEVCAYYGETCMDVYHFASGLYVTTEDCTTVNPNSGGKFYAECY